MDGTAGCAQEGQLAGIAERQRYLEAARSSVALIVVLEIDGFKRHIDERGRGLPGFRVSRACALGGLGRVSGSEVLSGAMRSSGTQTIPRECRSAPRARSTAAEPAAEVNRSAHEPSQCAPHVRQAQKRGTGNSGPSAPPKRKNAHNRERFAGPRPSVGDTGLENLPGGVLRLSPPCLLRSGAPRCPQLRSRCDHACDHGRVPPRRLLFVSMKEGWLSMASVVWGQGPLVGWWLGAALISLLPPRGRTRRHWRPAPGAQFQKGRQAARRKAAPPEAGVGAKGWLVVSMCQIASVSFLAMSIWATLAPRCLPRRFLLRW
jgi:hypothetical protein